MKDERRESGNVEISPRRIWSTVGVWYGNLAKGAVPALEALGD